MGGGKVPKNNSWGSGCVLVANYFEVSSGGAAGQWGAAVLNFVDADLQAPLGWRGRARGAPLWGVATRRFCGRGRRIRPPAIRQICGEEKSCLLDLEFGAKFIVIGESTGARIMLAASIHGQRILGRQ